MPATDLPNIDPAVLHQPDLQPVQLTDETMDKIAQAMGCPVESMMFEPYPS